MVEQEAANNRFTMFAEILPDNKKTRDLLEKREQIAKQRAEKEEALRQQRLTDEKNAKKREKELTLQKERAANAAAMMQKLREQEMSQSNKLPPRMYTFFNKLYGQNTSQDWAISGLDLKSKCRMLCAQVAYNSTLTCLNLNRSQLSDEDGAVCAQILYSNKVLRKLELEGNKLGQKSLVEFSNALLYNKTLKCLDLESNKLFEAVSIVQLTKDKEKNGEIAKPGIQLFCAALQANKTLISLNIANNGLKPDSGKHFRNIFEHNYSLIDFEFHFNDFHLQDVNQIQDDLIRNRTKFEEERIREWRERKLMRKEGEDMKGKNLKDETKAEAKRMEVEQKELRETEIEQKWKKFVVESEIEKQLTIQQLIELAEIRGKGKKGKKRGGGGKKKKK